MKDTQLSKRGAVALFKRYHLTVFIIFIAAILACVVLLINNAIFNPPESDDPATSTQTQVDPSAAAASSILQPLHQSDSVSEAPPLPSGRFNPFKAE